MSFSKSTIVLNHHQLEAEKNIELVQWCPDLVYPDLVDCRDLVD